MPRPTRCCVLRNAHVHTAGENLRTSGAVASVPGLVTVVTGTTARVRLVTQFADDLALQIDARRPCLVRSVPTLPVAGQPGGPRVRLVIVGARTGGEQRAE